LTRIEDLLGINNLPRIRTMTEEKDKKPTEQMPITRREFALGSMALIGSYSFAGTEKLPPLSSEAKAWNLEKEGDVGDLMDARHILDDDIKRVIEQAEKTGKKLYDPGSKRLLSKLRVRETYFYVEYSPISGGYKIHTAYTHRFFLEGDPQ
jgi:hypothetical protein